MDKDVLVVKGDTVEQAIAHALEILNAEENEVAVQVVDWGEPGVLGIGKRPVAVRVALRAGLQSRQPGTRPWIYGNWRRLYKSRLEIKVDKQATYAAICDGELLVRHPDAGPFPTLVPCRGVEVRINGQLVHTPQQVKMSDKVTIKTLRKEIAGQWHIELTEDELQAVIKLQPHIIRTYKLCDLPPARTLRLQVKEEEQRLPPLSLTELMEELKRLGVKQGIDWDCCQRVTEQPLSGEVVIAKGVPPTPSKDGYLEVFCLTEPRYPITVSEAEKVDFRQLFNINSVVKGAILARKHPPSPGENGISVRGEPVAPQPPVDVVLRLGKGVELHNETDIIAVQPGRPVLKEKGRSVYITVEPVLVHPGNVDMESGNLSFSGHIRVQGDVQEGMRVQANEDVMVQGLVSDATVQAGGSVYVWGNVISSTIVAGGPAAIVGRFLDILAQLAGELENLINYIKQLRQYGATSSVRQIIQVLLQHKCQSLPQLIKDFRRMLEQLPPRLDIRALEQFAQHLVVAIGVGREIEVQEIEELIKRCQEWTSAIVAASTSQGDVQVNSLLNSSVTATGNVHILGGCSDHSQVRAGGEVRVGGVFRGGHIQGKGTVVVGELGSPVGTYTTVNVAADALVKVGFLHENVHIVVGKRAYVSQRQERNVQFYYDSKEDKVVKTYSAPI